MGVAGLREFIQQNSNNICNDPVINNATNLINEPRQEVPNLNLVDRQSRAFLKNQENYILRDMFEDGNFKISFRLTFEKQR